jgi:hypothetical protein
VVLEGVLHLFLSLLRVVRMVDFLRHPVNILLVGIGGDEAVVKKFKKCSGHGSLWYQRMREKSTRGVALANLGGRDLSRITGSRRIGRWEIMGSLSNQSGVFRAETFAKRMHK